jgi:hypothetical protein
MPQNDLPGAADVRAAMAAQINNEFNRLVDQGAITGVEKVSTPTAPAPAVAAPAAVAPTAPAATPAAPAPAAAPAIPAPGVPFDREVHGLGKYNTVEELRKGYYEAVNTLSSTLDKLSSLQQQQAVAPPVATVPASVPGGSPRVNPAARNPIDFASDPVLTKFAEESNVPIETVVAAMDRVASLRADQAVDARFAPMQAMTDAEAQMRAQYPEAANHVVEVGNFIKANPNIAARVGNLINAGDAFGGMEYAYTMYMAQMGIKQERSMVANAAVAEEERLKARAEAGLPTSPNTGVLAATRAANAPPTVEEINALNQAAGHGLSQDAAAVIRRRALLGSQLPPELRTWEQR